MNQPRLNLHHPLISVALITHNMREGLKACLEALLGQTFQDFEIIVVDDRSSDGTEAMIRQLADSRIHYRRNEQRLGYGATRNLSIREIRGKYVFFTDADCVPERNWLEKGVEVYQSQTCIGFVGTTLPSRVSQRRSERVVGNQKGYFMTCNMSFTAEILKQLGGFDPAFDVGQEDVELGLRAKQHGPIIFAEDVLVYHRVEPYTLRRLFTDARRYKTQVMIFKRYRHDPYHRDHSPPIVKGIFLKPEDWKILLLPFLLLRSPANKSLKDFLMIPCIYAATIYRRWIIWKTALREKILLV